MTTEQTDELALITRLCEVTGWDIKQPFTAPLLAMTALDAMTWLISDCGANEAEFVISETQVYVNVHTLYETIAMRGLNNYDGTTRGRALVIIRAVCEIAEGEG